MPRPRHWRRFALVAGLLAAATGCGPDLGAWLYTLGLVPEQKVSAEYKFPDGPVLILVDDDLGLIQPPLACTALVEALAKQLKAHHVADKVTTNEELARIRQAAPDFDRLSIRQVGRRAHADTVLWINVEDFSLEDDLELVATPAQFVVRLKVFNARAENKQELRLWPPQREGRFVTVAVSPHDIRACKSLAEVHRKIAADMADKIAKLFYDHTIEHYPRRWHHMIGRRQVEMSDVSPIAGKENARSHVAVGLYAIAGAGRGRLPRRDQAGLPGSGPAAPPRQARRG